MAQRIQTTKARAKTNDHATILRECAESCSSTLAYCLGQGEDHVEENHLKAMVDCAEICNGTANFVARESELHATLMKACAEACGRCAETCEEFEGDETMEACAETCRRCEEACNAM